MFHLSLFSMMTVREFYHAGNINYTSGMCMKGSELNVNIGLQTNTNVGEIDC